MIELKNIYKSFEDHLILNNISFTIKRGEPVCIFGRSGIGKTTILNILAGLLKQDQGYVNGLELIKTSFLFQEDRLLPWLTGKQNIEAVTEQKLNDTLITSLNLQDFLNKYPDEMSGGMKRRIAIARSLAYNGELVLFDEALKGLDNTLKQSAMQLIKQQMQDKYFVFVTHDIEEAIALSAKIILINGAPATITKEIIKSQINANPDTVKELLLNDV